MPSAARRPRLWLLLPLVVACEEPFNFVAPNPVAGVTVSPDTGTVVSGDAVQLVAVMVDSAGDTLTGRVAVWTTLTPAVAAVSAAGLVQTLNPGLATVIATAEGESDTARFTVVAIALRAVAAGDQHSCALGNNNRAYCWGWAIYGQLGNGLTPFQSTTPVAVSGARRYTTLASGGDHSCAVSTSGTLECWGRNHALQLGRAIITDHTVPAPLAGGGPPLAHPTAGEAFSCARAADNLGWCWGDNQEGQLGDSAAATRALAAPVAGGRAYTALAAGWRHACGVSGGSMFCWGANDRGQLGDSSVGGLRRFPAAVVGNLTFVGVASGGAHSCGVHPNGQLSCWGDNTRGQLGTGTPDTLTPSPAIVANVSNAVAVTAGRRHTCTLLADSTAWCWGANDKGQLGDSTLSDRPTPVAVAGGLKFRSIAAGGEHNCGVATTGGVYCWGAGGVGQLGNNGVADKPHPVAVISP